MKITDIKTFVVDCFRTNWVFVKVYTDEGITGVGEGTLEYKEKALVGAIEHIRSYLLGKDPRQIEKHYHDIYRDAYWRGGAVLMPEGEEMGRKLYDTVTELLRDEDRRTQMSKALKQSVVIDSAQRICDMVEELAGKG